MHKCRGIFENSVEHDKEVEDQIFNIAVEILRDDIGSEF